MGWSPFHTQVSFQTRLIYAYDATFGTKIFLSNKLAVKRNVYVAQLSAMKGTRHTRRVKFCQFGAYCSPSDITVECQTQCTPLT
jgi:hypothetical protein